MQGKAAAAVNNPPFARGREKRCCVFDLVACHRNLWSSLAKLQKARNRRDQKGNSQALARVFFLEGYRFTHNNDITKGLFHQMGCQWLDGAVAAATGMTKKCQCHEKARKITGRGEIGLSTETAAREREMERGGEMASR